MSRRPTNQPREVTPFISLTSSHVSERFYVVHLIDGTYELFRHFYGLRRFTRVKGSASRGVDRPYGAVVGVLQTVLQMIDPVKGSASRGPVPAGDSASRGQTGTYLGVATDHVIESFRNRLWPDYKPGAVTEQRPLRHF